MNTPTATTATTKKPEQTPLIPIAEQPVAKPTGPSAAVQASAELKASLKRQEGIAEVVVYIPVNRIVPSPTNPRKTFDRNYLDELAATIAIGGVHQNIVLREWTAKPSDVQKALDIYGGLGLKLDPGFNVGDNIFQIVFGECRWQGSLLAARETIPAVVRNLSNEQVQEVQIIENLQRKDLDPLDEAEGFAALMGIGEFKPEKPLTGTEIAARIGKSPQYVSAMVKLCSLAEWGKQILRNGWITPGHAVLIARLGDFEAQSRAMYAVFNETWNAHHHTVVDAVRRKAEAGAPIMSEKALRIWIADNERCDLTKVPWKLDDAELLPAAGACTVCPHRSGSDPALFSDIAGDDKQRCMKPACFAQKKQTHINKEHDNARMTNQVLQKISVQEAPAPALPNATVLKAGQWVPARRGECKQTVRAIFINGGDQEGHTPFVCVDAKCRVHKHPPIVVPFEPKEFEAKSHHGGTETRSGAGDGQTALAHSAFTGEGSSSLVAKGGTGAAAALAPARTREESSAAEHEQTMQAARHRAEAAVNELVVHRVLAAHAAAIKKPDEDFLRDVAEHFLATVYMDPDRVIAGLGYDPDKEDGEIIDRVKQKGSLAELARLVWLLMVPDTIDHESDQVKTWAKASKLDVGKVRKELTARIEKACFYCGCTELTPCEIDGPNGESKKCFHMRSGAGVKLHGTACDARPCLEAALKEEQSGVQPDPGIVTQQTPVNQKPNTHHGDTETRRTAPAKTSTAKVAKVAKGKDKPKPTAAKKAAPSAKVKPKANSQKPKAKKK